MSDSDDDYGPALPPGFNAQPSASIGPTLPPHLAAKLNQSDNVSDDDDQKPSPQDQQEESDDEDIIGPVLPGSEADKKRNYGPQRPSSSTEDAGKLGREEWMTVVPKKVEKKLGLTQKSVTSFSKASGQELDEALQAPSQKEVDISNALDDYSVIMLYHGC